MILPDQVEEVMGDIMMVLRVPLADLSVMSLPELMHWHGIASDRWKLMSQLPRMV